MYCNNVIVRLSGWRSLTMVVGGKHFARNKASYSSSIEQRREKHKALSTVYSRSDICHVRRSGGGTLKYSYNLDISRLRCVKLWQNAAVRPPIAQKT